MKYQHEEFPQPDEPMSIREARKARRMWEDDLRRQMIVVGLDPKDRFENMKEATAVIRLLMRNEAIVTNKEVSDALGYPYSVQHNTSGKDREYMKRGYTMKLSVDGNGSGGKDRIFSMPGLALVAMSAKTEKGQAVRAWMAEVVAMAARHPDFRHLFPSE